MELTTRMGNLTGDAQKDLKTLYSFVFQMNEEMRYLMNNLDVTNFNDLGLARYENGRMQIYTERLEIQAEKLTAEFKESDEQMKTTLEASIGGLRTEVTEEINGLGTRVSTVEQTANGLRSTVNSHTSSISSMGSQITQNEDKISLVVMENYGVKSIRAAEIVTAINAAGSSVKISADHVDITGVVTVTDLAGEGTVEINAGNIKAGGTIEGVKFISNSEVNGWVSIEEGMVRCAGNSFISGDLTGLHMESMGFDFYTESVFDFHLPSGNRIRISDNGILAVNYAGEIKAVYNFTSV
jgi:hypothetical protein